MALSYIQYPADGVTDTFNIPFPFISKSHIQVKVNGVLDATVTFPTASTVKTSTMPPNGVIVEVRRVTPNTSRLVDFADGSLLGESDLDLSALQAFYIAQELLDTLAVTLGQNAVLQWDAQNKRITNVADGIAGTDAATVGQIQSLSTNGLLPTGTGNGGKYLRQKINETGLEYRTTPETQNDLGLPAINGNGNKYIRVNSPGTGFETRTNAEQRTDLGLPDTSSNANNYLRVNTGGTAFEARTPLQVKTDIGIGNPKGFLYCTPPVYTSASTFTVGSLNVRSSLDDGDIAKTASTTVDIGTSGLNGLASGNITGTVSITNGSTNLTGSGTNFTSDLVVGDLVKIGTAFYSIASITSSTVATLGQNAIQTLSGTTLQRGGENSNWWYFLYAVTNGTTPGLILSHRNMAAGQSLADLPSGYTKYRQLPFAVRNDASGNFVPFFVTTGFGFWDIWYRDYEFTGIYLMLSGGLSTAAFTSPGGGVNVDCSSIIPAISKLGFFHFIFENNGGGGSFFHFVKNPDSNATIGTIVGLTPPTGPGTQYSWYPHSINASQQIAYRITSGGRFGIGVLGFRVTEVI